MPRREVVHLAKYVEAELLIEPTRLEAEGDH